MITSGTCLGGTIPGRRHTRLLRLMRECGVLSSGRGHAHARSYDYLIFCRPAAVSRLVTEYIQGTEDKKQLHRSPTCTIARTVVISQLVRAS